MAKRAPDTAPENRRIFTSSSREIGTAFATLVHQRAVALMTTPDALFTSQRTQIVTLAARHAIPTIFTSSEFAKAGGPDELWHKP